MLEVFPKHKQFTVIEYQQLSNLGIISPEEKTELIDGQILIMAAQNPLHVACTQLIYDYLTDALKGIAFVRIQAPIQLSDRSLPEPDIAVVKLPKEQYYERHPKPEDIYLVIEVSDATSRYDLTTKADMYAMAGIQDYLVVDAVGRKVNVFSEPVKGNYKDKTTCDENEGMVYPHLNFGLRFAWFFPSRA